MGVCYRKLGSCQLKYTVSMNLYLPSQFQAKTRHSSVLPLKLKVLGSARGEKVYYKAKFLVLRLINCMCLNIKEMSMKAVGLSADFRPARGPWTPATSALGGGRDSSASLPCWLAIFRTPARCQAAIRGWEGRAPCCEQARHSLHPTPVPP